MALPLPGSPASTWASFGERLKHIFHGADPRVCIAFWLFGLINNVLYVIILSAALDLVGPNIPKGVVLLADVVPSFLTKLCAPYFIHAIPYHARIVVFVALSASGMLLIALTPDYKDGGAVATKMVGVMLASLSSGGGELSFLGLVHYYGPFSLAAWGSGTGGAGLIGAGAYALATTELRFSVKATLLASACLPAVMLVSFFLILPRGPLKAADLRSLSQTTSHDGDDAPKNNTLSNTLPGDEEVIDAEDAGLLSSTNESHARPTQNHGLSRFSQNLRRARRLFFPFMLPLLLVYVAEYTINQGVAPTLLFPLKDSPFKHFRAFYPAYNAIYQAGVFISRSSTPFFRIHKLYLPSFLQVLNLVILTAHALFNFIPSVYIVFAIVFWEGLLGGLVYVNTFAEIRDTVPKEDREFSLGATTVSDSGGICIAGVIGMAFEVWLCKWQVDRGRDYCKRT
jgi:battenin